MCGICGEFQFQVTEERDAGTIRHLSELMARRGPDNEGFWRDDRWRCWLAFRRLAILDLSPTGHQPMLTADGRFALAFNGEMYNFRTLRQDLEKEGVQFRSTGDTEVVLYALAHWGREALFRFNGMFALAFYDLHEQTLLLARDHAGIKPLYYLLATEGLFFASQYDQLLAHPWRRNLEISETGLALYLRLGYIPAPHAILERTHLLEPGAWVLASAGGRIQRGRFFNFPVYPQPDLFGQEAYEAVNQAVSDAVARQMISDVPLGAFLSGGIDSPLVAAKAQSHRDRPLQAYTIGSDGSEFDESADASLYATALGVTHIIQQFAPDQVLDWLDRVVAACGEPFADYSIFPTMMVSEMARRDVTVMLSGDGGDELFWGYATRLSLVLQRAADFRQAHWWRSVRWGAKHYLGIGDGNKNLRWPGIGAWYRTKHSRLTDSMLEALFRVVPAWPADFALFEYDGWDLDQTAQWLRWNEFVGHLSMVLLKVDRASMYHSLEVRVPLLDKELIELAMRVDWRSCLDLERRIGKLPLRRALAHHLTFQTQVKRGFTVPMNAWLRGPLYSLFCDLVLSRQELLGLPIHRPALENLLECHRSGRADNAWGLWSLLSLSLWSDHHFSKTPLLS